MTRDEFISGYLERSKIPVECRTDDGFQRGSFRLHALPCDCGEDHCNGWAMVSSDFVEHHMEFYAPKEEA